MEKKDIIGEFIEKMIISWDVLQRIKFSKKYKTRKIKTPNGRKDNL